MPSALPRPEKLGRWSLLGSPDRRGEKPRGVVAGKEIHCPGGHLLHHAGEKPDDMRGNSDVTSRQVALLRDRYGIDLNHVRRLMALGQIASHEARAEQACEMYESFGIDVEPAPEPVHAEGSPRSPKPRGRRSISGRSDYGYLGSSLASTTVFQRPSRGVRRSVPEAAPRRGGRKGRTRIRRWENPNAEGRASV